MFTDLNLEQKSLREDYVGFWKDDDFESAYDIIESGEVDSIAAQASVFNHFTQTTGEEWNLIDLQTQALDNYEEFKADRIKVSATAPIGLTTGQVYFQIV